MDHIVNQTDIDTIIKLDDIFATINAKYGPPPDWNRPQGFITLGRIILEQQVSLQSTNAHFNKLNSFIPAFTPQEILKLSDDQMRLCQISRQKSRYLKELSRALLEGKLEFEKLPGLTLDEVRTRLKEIKGIGDGTASQFEGKTAQIPGLKERQQADFLRFLENKGVKSISFSTYQTPDLKELLSKGDNPRAESFEVYYYHSDHLGTNTIVTEMNGNPYQFFVN